MSQFLYDLLSGKLDEIAAFYKVRPRITLIVRMPGKPDECAFLSDDAWPDAVATVERLYGDRKAFKAGPAEPKPEATASQPGEAFTARQREDRAACPMHRCGESPCGMGCACEGTCLACHQAEPAPPRPAPDAVAEAAERLRYAIAKHKTGCNCDACDSGEDLLRALDARRRG